MCAPHLNTSDKREGELSFVNGGDVSELFGCRISADAPRRTNAGVKFSKSLSEEIVYPADKVFDPLFSSGYANYASVEVGDCAVAAVLSDAFYEKNSGEGSAAMIEHRLGDGIAILLTSLDYPGAGQTYELYRTVVHELLRASHKNADVKVFANDRVRFSVYEEGDVYLLNTDFDVPSYAKVVKGDSVTELTLAPCEMKHIKI